MVVRLELKQKVNQLVEELRRNDGLISDLNIKNTNLQQTVNNLTQRLDIRD